MSDFCRLLFLICALGFAPASPAADSYDETLEKHFATQDAGSNQVSDNAEAGQNLTQEQARVAALERAIVAETRTLAAGPQVTPPPPVVNHQVLLWALALLLGAGLALPRIIRLLNERFDPWKSSATAGGRVSSALRAEEAAFSKFMESFKIGLVPRAGDSPPLASLPMENAPVRMFYSQAAEILGKLSKLLATIPLAPSETRQQSQLVELHRELGVLKGAAGLPELLPVWQMAAAMEGLVKQLIDKASYLTPSTLRTVAGGVDGLKNLCVPGLRADILTNPPIRLLAVDDDPVCRMAISSALKKALNQPDLAENGESALALATERVYDVIFLDVQMPGIDGFELCTKIHETITNAATPTVFVTILNDFAARTQSVLKGGSDLISKPFLTFEITVKALTFILKNRLQAPVRTAVARNRSLDESIPPSPLLTDRSPASNCIQKLNADSAAAIPPESPAAARRQVVPPARPNSMVARDNSPQDIINAFLTRESAQIGPLRELIQAASQTKDERVRLDTLGDFYLRINSMMPTVGMEQEHSALRLSRALEGLLKKLLLNTKHVTPSSLQTITAAADLLQELCAGWVKPDLAVNPPIRMLAVDDDLVSLRTISSALQMVFDKPETAESGEAALALASGKPFDVIFMDVQMPGMDGFTTCSRIHETVYNGITPVVFVASHGDFEARSKASVSGGSDFITKPFLTAELTVKALTYALRGRLQKKAAQNLITLMKTA